MSDYFTKTGDFCNTCGMEPCVCGPLTSSRDGGTPVKRSVIKSGESQGVYGLDDRSPQPTSGGLRDDVREDLFTPGCIRTVGGRYVNLLDPDPATFDIGDIAHALSRIPRFGGHLPVFYSVAQHSLAVCARLSRLPHVHQYQGLMHDASEAYLLDLPTPLKDVLPDYKRIERRMMDRLAARFEFIWPMLETVRQVDHAVLHEEWNDLMLGNVAVAPRDAKDIERMFLAKFKELRPWTE